MNTALLVLAIILVIAALVFGTIALLSGADPGLVPADPDSRARPLPNNRSLTEDDIHGVRFDVTLRGYRMYQVDRMLRRVAYDLGYKDEMIAVLEAEVAALREGRLEDADSLRKAREAAASGEAEPAEPDASSEETGRAAGPDDIDQIGADQSADQSAGQRVGERGGERGGGPGGQAPAGGKNRSRRAKSPAALSDPMAAGG